MIGVGTLINTAAVIVDSFGLVTVAPLTAKGNHLHLITVRHLDYYLLL